MAEGNLQGLSFGVKLSTQPLEDHTQGCGKPRVTIPQGEHAPGGHLFWLIIAVHRAVAVTDTTAIHWRTNLKPAWKETVLDPRAIASIRSADGKQTSYWVEASRTAIWNTERVETGQFSIEFRIRHRFLTETLVGLSVRNKHPNPRIEAQETHLLGGTSVVSRDDQPNPRFFDVHRKQRSHQIHMNELFMTTCVSLSRTHYRLLWWKRIRFVILANIPILYHVST